MALQDFAYAFRSMRKYPIACAVAIASLGAGIGAATATLTIRNAVFRNPPPLSPQPEQLFEAFMPTPERGYRAAAPAGVFTLWRHETRMVAGIAAARPAVTTEVRTADGAQTAGVRPVTPELFHVLGVAPAIGRTFATQGGDKDASPDLSAAVLSYDFWQRSFRGRPEAIGSVVWIDGRPYTVIGVMPEGFWVFDMETKVWTTLDVNALPPDALLQVILRRRPDTPLIALLQTFQSHVARYVSGLPITQRRARVQIVQMQGTPVGHAIAPAVVWLMAGCVALTLLIACMNVAVLVMAQWTGREREISIRAALGAGRWRIVRGLLAESVLLAASGGILGVCATFVLRAVALRRAPANIDLFDFSIDAGVLARTALITIGAGIFAGFGPALYETRRIQEDPIRGIPSDRVRQRWRSVLVVMEITVTVALLVVTSAMMDGYRRAVSADLGFDIRPLLAATVEAPQGVRMAEIRERLRALPGVASVAISTTPAMNRPERQAVALDGAGSNSMLAERSIIGSEFWTTLGIPVRLGRTFSSESDGANGGRVAIVNEALAGRMWPGRSPIGLQLWSEGRSYDVIGVAADYKNTPLTASAPAFYLPMSAADGPLTRLTFYIRSKTNPADLVQPVRKDIRAAGTDHVVDSAFTLQSVAEIIGREIMAAVYPMTPLISTGLLLTAAGIYGVLAFAVTRRSRELAIRLAVGASARQLIMLVAILSVRVVALGIFFGIGTTFALSRFIRGQGGVFDSPSPAVFVVPMMVVLAVALLATWMPSRRALSIDLANLLRTD